MKRDGERTTATANASGRERKAAIYTSRQGTRRMRSDGTGPSVGAVRVCYYYTARQPLCITSAAARKVFVGGRERAQAIVRGMCPDTPAGLGAEATRLFRVFRVSGRRAFRVGSCHCARLGNSCLERCISRWQVTASSTSLKYLPPSVFRFRFRVAPSVFRVPCPLASSHRFCCPAVSLAAA